MSFKEEDGNGSILGLLSNPSIDDDQELKYLHFRDVCLFVCNCSGDEIFRRTTKLGHQFFSNFAHKLVGSGTLKEEIRNLEE